MKKLNKLAVLGVAALAVTLAACEDKLSSDDINYPEESVSRLFAPIEFAYVTPIIDGYKLSWSAVRGAEGYYVQFSEDSLFNEGPEDY